MDHIPVLLGSMRYEFRMQFRRRALWITMALIIALEVALMMRGGPINPLIQSVHNFDTLTAVVFWTNLVNTILPAAMGCLLADRLPRDRRVKVEELFGSTPGALGIRIVGKYLGSVLATLLPMFAFYCVGIGAILFATHDLMTIPLALATFAAIVLPGNLFISAFSIACPAIMWVPVYQFLFVGYWFWGNWMHSRFIPSLSDTILSPIGGFISIGFFGQRGWFAYTASMEHATILEGLESMILLLSIAALVMITLIQLLKWQQARQ